MLENMNRKPDAYARVLGSAEYSKVHGDVYFFGVYGGTIVVARIYGLPVIGDEPVSGNFHGFHIHAGSSCTGTAAEPFKNADGHFNPGNSDHPNHAGDLPPLLANENMTWSAVYTERFNPEDVVGHTVIIHAMADDFHSQPSGNAGTMIACGEIKE